MQRTPGQLLSSLAIAIACSAALGCGANETVLEDAFAAPVENLTEIDGPNTEYQNDDFVVQGVISASPQNGSIDDEYETFHITLEAWRDSEGTAGSQPLTLLLPTEPGGRYMELPAYSIARFRVLLSTDRTRAIVKQILKPVLPDEEFEAVAKKLQEPITATHPLIGKMKYDRSMDWFEAKNVDWAGHKIEVVLNVMSDEFDKNSNLIDAFLANSATWKTRLEKQAVTDLLPLAKEWKAEGEPDITQGSLLQRMKPRSIIIYDDGSFAFWYADDGMFGGHSIRIDGSIEEGPTQAGIVG